MDRHPGSQRIDQRLQPVHERKARCDGFRLLRAPVFFPHATDLPLHEAAVTPLQRVQSRKGRRQRQLRGIARIDARDEWLDRIIQEFAAQAARHELGD
ncbi:hypothetical protein D3C83_21030 [compost metagenome]